MAEAGYLVDSSYGYLNTGIKGDNSFDPNVGKSDAIVTYATVLKIENGNIYISPKDLDQSTIFRRGNRSQQPTINILNSNIANMPKAGDTIIVLFDGSDYDYLGKSQKTIGTGQENQNFLDKTKNNPSVAKIEQDLGIKSTNGKADTSNNEEALQSPNIMEAPYHFVPNVVYHKNALNFGSWNHMIVFEKFGTSISLNSTYESGSLIGWSNNKYGYYPQVFNTNDFWGRSLWNNSNNSTENKPEALTWKDQWNNSLVGYNNYIASTQGSTHIYSSNNISLSAEENVSIDSKKSTYINSDNEIRLQTQKLNLIAEKINLVAENANKSAVLGEDLVTILNNIYSVLYDMSNWMATHSHAMHGAVALPPPSIVEPPNVSNILSNNVKLK